MYFVLENVARTGVARNESGSNTGCPTAFTPRDREEQTQAVWIWRGKIFLSIGVDMSKL